MSKIGGLICFKITNEVPTCLVYTAAHRTYTEIAGRSSLIFNGTRGYLMPFQPNCNAISHQNTPPAVQLQS